MLRTDEPKQHNTTPNTVLIMKLYYTPIRAPLADLRDVSRVLIGGESVTLENYPDNGGWVATGWEDGLPLYRKPITDAQALELVNRFPLSILLP